MTSSCRTLSWHELFRLMAKNVGWWRHILFNVHVFTETRMYVSGIDKWTNEWKWLRRRLPENSVGITINYLLLFHCMWQDIWRYGERKRERERESQSRGKEQRISSQLNLLTTCYVACDMHEISVNSRLCALREGATYLVDGVTLLW